MIRLKMVVILFFSMLFGCKSGGYVNLMKYHYPVSFTEESKVYVYSEEKNLSNKKYLHINFSVLNGDTILTTETYDSKLILVESSKERVSFENIELMFFSIYKDSVETSTTVEKGITYLDFFPIDSVIETSISYTIEENNYLFKRKRKPIRVAEEYWLDKEIETIVFRDEVLFLSNNIDTFKYSQETYFGEGVGIIGYEKIYEDGQRQKFKLTKIMTGTQWTELIKN